MGVILTLLEVCEAAEGERSRSPNLPAASSQVLQSPGCSLQGVWVGALRQQREVRLHNGGVPQHLDAFRGLRQVRKGANAVPLWSKTHKVEETNMLNLLVCVVDFDNNFGSFCWFRPGRFSDGRESGRTRKKSARDQPHRNQV